MVHPESSRRRLREVTHFLSPRKRCASGKMTVGMNRFAVAPSAFWGAIVRLARSDVRSKAPLTRRPRNKAPGAFAVCEIHAFASVGEFGF